MGSTANVLNTNTNPLPGQQITGLENIDIETLIRNEVQRATQGTQTQLNTQAAQNQGAPGPIKLNFQGQELTFNSPEELSQSIQNALATQQAQLLAQFQGQTAPSPNDAAQIPGFDREKFASQVGEDPLKGLDYALGHLLFGRDVPNASQILRAQLDAAVQTKQQLAAYQFKEKYPSFPADPRAVGVLDQIRQSLGLSADSADAWEAAYATGVARGVLPPPQRSQQLQQQPQQPQQNPRNFEQINDNPYIVNNLVPPALGRSTAQELPPSIVEQAENLTTSQLEEVIRKASGQIAW